MGNLANMGGVQEMSNFTDEPEAIAGYTSVCEEHVVAAIHTSKSLVCPGSAIASSAHVRRAMKS